MTRCSTPHLLEEASAGRTCGSTDSRDIILVSARGCILLGRRNGWPEAPWCFLAGPVTPGQSPAQCASQYIERLFRLEIGSERFNSVCHWSTRAARGSELLSTLRCAVATKLHANEERSVDLDLVDVQEYSELKWFEPTEIVENSFFNNILRWGVASFIQDLEHDRLENSVEALDYDETIANAAKRYIAAAKVASIRAKAVENHGMFEIAGRTSEQLGSVHIRRVGDPLAATWQPVDQRLPDQTQESGYMHQNREFFKALAELEDMGFPPAEAAQALHAEDGVLERAIAKLVSSPGRPQSRPSFTHGGQSLRSCVICLSQPRQGTLRPCGHNVACESCAAVLSASRQPCPVCRTVVQRFVRGAFEQTFVGREELQEALASAEHSEVRESDESFEFLPEPRTERRSMIGISTRPGPAARHMRVAPRGCSWQAMREDGGYDQIAEWEQIERAYQAYMRQDHFPIDGSDRSCVQFRSRSRQECYKIDFREMQRIDESGIRRHVRRVAT